MGRQVTGCTAGTEQSRTDPSVVFVPTDLSILARCVTNVYVTTRQTGGGDRRARVDKKEEKRETEGAKRGKEDEGKNCGERSRTEAHRT